MATGRPLVISLARYAAPIRQYSVFPLSAPWPLEQLVMCPQVTHLSPDCGEVSQGGGLSWLPRKVRVAKPRPDSNRRRFNHPCSWAALPTELQGHRVPNSRGSGFHHHPICCVKEVENEIEWCKRSIPYILYHNIWINQYICIQYFVFFRMDGGTPLLYFLQVAEHTQQTLTKHQEHHHAYFYLPLYTRKGS